MIITATFCLYILITLALGIYSYMKTKTMSDYLLANKGLGALTSALSAGASDMSGWLLLGLPGLAFAGHSGCLWVAASLLLGTYCNWRFIATRLREATAHSDTALTIPRYLENRFQDENGILRPLSAIFIIIFFTLYASAGLIAAGKLFEQAFHLQPWVGITISACLMVVYTIFGGFLAVAWTDVFQALLMSIALVIVPTYIFSISWDKEITQTIPELSLTEIISQASWGLGYFGQPHILSRFMAIKDTREIPKATLYGTLWCAACLFGALSSGYAGFLYFDGNLSDPESVFMALVQIAFPPFVVGTLLAAIFGAIISTADSQLLVATSSLICDLLPTNHRYYARINQSITYGRIAIIVITLCAMGIALTQSSMVLEMVSFAWAGFGAALGPVLLVSLYTKELNTKAAIAGLVSGASTVIAWRYLELPIYELLPGFLISLTSSYAVNILSKAKRA